MLYIGETGRWLRTRFGEHRRTVTIFSPQHLTFAQDMLLVQTTAKKTESTIQTVLPNTSRLSFSRKLGHCPRQNARANKYTLIKTNQCLEPKSKIVHFSILKLYRRCGQENSQYHPSSKFSRDDQEWNEGKEWSITRQEMISLLRVDENRIQSCFHQPSTGWSFLAV